MRICIPLQDTNVVQTEHSFEIQNHSATENPTMRNVYNQNWFTDYEWSRIDSPNKWFRIHVEESQEIDDPDQNSVDDKTQFVDMGIATP